MIEVFVKRTPVEKLILLLIGVCMALRLGLVFTYEANWDEFLNLSMVYDHARGDLQDILQTLFVHGFSWLYMISDNEVDQIIAARLVIYGMAVATAGFIFLISRKFLPLHAALFAVLCYVSFSFVLRQGTSFRTDPIAAFILMAALWIIVCKPQHMRFAVIAGGLIGLAGMITIKAIFYVPTISLLLLLSLIPAKNRGRAFMYALVAGCVALASFLAVYFLHSLTFQDTVSTAGFLERTAGKTLGERDYYNAINNFRLAAVMNPVFWLMMILGIAVCLRGLVRSKGVERIRSASLLSFGVILGSLLVYTETFAYYYPFMLAPAAVLCGAGLGIVSAERNLVATISASILLGIFLIINTLPALSKNNAAQRETLAVIHTAFPDPTAYIDRCSMVSAYPKRGIFLSVWGMTDYYRAGVPIMEGIIRQNQPRFLIANRHMLELDKIEPHQYGPKYFGFFQADIETLKANYIHHWGAIYVAGKKFDISVSDHTWSFDILIEGLYTLESKGPVVLDGRSVQPGTVVSLDRGSHEIRSAGTYGQIVLRWGDALYRPDTPAPQGQLFNGF